MELADTLALVKAGFTREEIREMELSQAPVQPNSIPVQEPVPAPAQSANPEPAQVVEPVAVAVPQPAPQPAQAQAEPTMAELMQSIAKLTSAVQANAIAQSVIPAGISNPPKAEDMLAEIIRPTFHQRGD